MVVLMWFSIGDCFGVGELWFSWYVGVVVYLYCEFWLLCDCYVIRISVICLVVVGWIDFDCCGC